MLRRTAIFALALIVTAPCYATLVEWNLNGATGDQATTSPTAAEANITGLSFSRGSGLTPSAAGNSISATGFDGAGAGDYFSFGFTVADGYTVDLTNLLIATRTSGTGPGTLGLYYSGDSFAAPLTTITQANTAYISTTADLSALLGLTGTVEFRLYEIGDTQADGSGATASTGTLRITNFGSINATGAATPVQFNGTVALAAIPEPTAALFGSLLAGAFGLMVARRPAGRE